MNLALIQVLSETELEGDLFSRTEEQIGRSRSDCWIVRRAEAYPICAIEVKSPFDGKNPKSPMKVMRNGHVYGQLFDYLQEIRAFHGIHHVLGIVTTYEEWRVCWFPESNDFAKATTESDTIESASVIKQGNIADIDERLLCGSRIFKHSEDALLNVLGTVLLKMKLFSEARNIIPDLNEQRHCMLVDEKSFYWRPIPPDLKEIDEYHFKLVSSKNLNKLYLLRYATASETSEGRVYIARDRRGYLCVVKFRKKSANTKLTDSKERLRFSQSRIDLASQEYEIWKVLYGEFSAKLCDLNGRAALVMPYVSPLSREELVAWDVEARDLLKKISEVRRDSGYIQYEGDRVEKVSGGFVEHVDLKLSHFGLHKTKDEEGESKTNLIIFDFGILKFHETSDAALSAMNENYKYIFLPNKRNHEDVASG